MVIYLFLLNHHAVMTEKKDIRWIQRFRNLQKAFLKLKEAVEEESLTELEKEGLSSDLNILMNLHGKPYRIYWKKEGMLE